MKKIRFQVLFLAITCLFLSGCFLPISSTTVSGKVTKYGEKPLAGAKVSLSGSETTTDADGKFTITAKHGPLDVLRLTVKKDGFVMREKVEFPGFLAPSEPIEVELMQTIGRKR